MSEVEWFSETVCCPELLLTQYSYFEELFNYSWALHNRCSGTSRSWHVYATVTFSFAEFPSRLISLGFHAERVIPLQRKKERNSSQFPVSSRLHYEISQRYWIKTLNFKLLGVHFFECRQASPTFFTTCITACSDAIIRMERKKERKKNNRVRFVLSDDRTAVYFSQLWNCKFERLTLSKCQAPRRRPTPLLQPPPGKRGQNLPLEPRAKLRKSQKAVGTRRPPPPSGERIEKSTKGWGSSMPSDQLRKQTERGLKSSLDGGYTLSSL